MLQVSPLCLFSSKLGEILGVCVCDVVRAPPHYFNKSIVPADGCDIKRIADDPSFVVELIL